MAVSQSDFDKDLASYNDAVTNYIAAVNAFIALPAVADLSAEDATVQSGLAAVQAAAASVPAPPVA